MSVVKTLIFSFDIHLPEGLLVAAVVIVDVHRSSQFCIVAEQLLFLPSDNY